MLLHWFLTYRLTKKLISAYEMSWIVLQELQKRFQLPNVALAVVPDNSRGWRIVLPKDDGRCLPTSRFTGPVVSSKNNFGNDTSKG